MDEAEMIREVQQPRSEYQLRRFVVGVHPTPEMRFYQCCIELQDMEHKLAFATLARRRIGIQVARLRATGDELDEIDAQRLELDLEQQGLAELGARREVECLRRILSEYKPYTRADIERAQPEYWAARLTRQAELQQLGARNGVGWAHLEAMFQAGCIGEPGAASLEQGATP